MRQNLWKSVAGSVLCLSLLAGCSVPGFYNQQAWLHRSNASWDTDSALCRRFSVALTEEDRREISRIRTEALRKELAAAESKIVIYVHPPDGPTPEQLVQDAKFEACLASRGWQSQLGI